MRRKFGLRRSRRGTAKAELGDVAGAIGQVAAGSMQVARIIDRIRQRGKIMADPGQAPPLQNLRRG